MLSVNTYGVKGTDMFPGLFEFFFAVYNLV